MLTTLASYRLASNNIDRTLAATADKPNVARDTQYYLDHISDVTTIDQFLADDKLFKYAMKAWGLEDMDYAKAFMRKVLTEGIDDKGAFANTLADSRYRDFAAAFNFNRYGDSATNFTSAQQDTVDQYMRQTVEEDAGNQNEGVRLALYFERKASSITSPMGILADKAMLQVVETALGLPESLSMLDIDKQAEIIGKKLDVTDFQDPDKVQKFLTRFAAMWDVSHSSAEQSPAVLLISQPTEANISVNLLTSLQNLKLGGN